MRRTFESVISVFCLLLPTYSWAGVEVRTYQFSVNQSFPFTVSCGECGPSLLGARADIAGTFTVLLDRDTGTGTLLKLNDRLVNVFNLLGSPTEPVWSPANPQIWDQGIIPEWTPSYEPPLEGMLSFENDTIFLISDGTRPSPDGRFVGIVPSFNIGMRGEQVSLSMVVPIMDWFITVTNAPAVLVPGDFNGDGAVDAADYVVLRNGLGSIYSQGDYVAWRQNYGTTTGEGAAVVGAATQSTGVPEPATVTALVVAILTNLAGRRCVCFRRVAQ